MCVPTRSKGRMCKVHQDDPISGRSMRVLPIPLIEVDYVDYSRTFPTRIGYSIVSGSLRK
jgi:hypothetical protein